MNSKIASARAASSNNQVMTVLVPDFQCYILRRILFRITAIIRRCAALTALVMLAACETFFPGQPAVVTTPLPTPAPAPVPTPAPVTTIPAIPAPVAPVPSVETPAGKLPAPVSVLRASR